MWLISSVSFSTQLIANDHLFIELEGEVIWISRIYRTPSFKELMLATSIVDDFGSPVLLRVQILDVSLLMKAVTHLRVSHFCIE